MARVEKPVVQALTASSTEEEFRVWKFNIEVYADAHDLPLLVPVNFLLHMVVERHLARQGVQHCFQPALFIRR